jgi:hypothetical protein
MNSVKTIQQFQLRLIEAASVNESCATDLLEVLRKLSCAEARCVIGIIGLLNHESEELKKLSKNLTAVCAPVMSA